MANLYPYLILVGISIIAATSWLLVQARRQAQIANELVRLNRDVNFDLPDFLRQCWKPLQQAGFRGISWQLDWFGSTLAKLEGREGEVVIQRKLEVEDITLVVNLYDSRRRFEQRFFNTMLSDNFFLLLYTDMWVKLGTVQGAFAQTAKLTVFLQHDMKNIVQLISLLAEQVENTPPGSELKVLEGMQAVMPDLRERSERFLSTLSSQAPTEDMKPVDLCELFHKSAKLHDLDFNISGSGSVLINEQSLTSIFDNLFGNYSDQNRRSPQQKPTIEISIEDMESQLKVSIKDLNGEPCQWPERLFEPFWSEKGHGLGIGLYHARQLTAGAGGSLQAITPQDDAMTFVVNLPKSL